MLYLMGSEAYSVGQVKRALAGLLFVVWSVAEDNEQEGAAGRDVACSDVTDAATASWHP